MLLWLLRSEGSDSSEVLEKVRLVHIHMYLWKSLWQNLPPDFGLGLWSFSFHCILLLPQLLGFRTGLLCCPTQVKSSRHLAVSYLVQYLVILRWFCLCLSVCLELSWIPITIHSLFLFLSILTFWLGGFFFSRNVTVIAYRTMLRFIWPFITDSTGVSNTEWFILHI